MEAFVWNQRYATGIQMVDQQHRHLVDIINLVGEMLAAENSAAEDIEAIYKQLADYARFHFANEERLMEEAGVAGHHVARHKQQHVQFIAQVMQMWRARETMSNPAEILHGFLASWLSFHILDEDQSMARQIIAIRAGEAAQTAFAAEHREADNNVAILLDALHKLYHLMALQNRDLADANLTLEAKVVARTRELSDVNIRLAGEQRELAELVRKMEDAQNQLLQSEKMAAIGQLAAGVAHEINNPIGFVNSNLGTLKNYIGDLLAVIDAYEACEGEHGIRSDRLSAIKTETDLDFLRQDAVALLSESRDGLDRVKKIVQDLKDFSHVNEAEWQEADLNEGLESTLNVVWNELKYKAQIVKEYGELPLVRCVPGHLNQVFMNLLLNAAQAIEQRGTITVRTGRKDDQVWIEISDTGAGISADVQKRVFEPFFTTKPVGKGTGLGLSLSYDIVVKEHGGHIGLESEPGMGTTFRIRLPANASADLAG